MKRLFDFTAALFGLVVLSPLLIVVSLLIWRQMGRPFIFRQVRPGLHGKPFAMYKFRTMSDERDANGELLPDHQRISAIGNWLRKTSIDELPELFNVLKGEMSLVGPRPLLMEYLPLYTEEQNQRHLMKPGITGWAQINGRNAISWEQKFDLDIWYVKQQSFTLDLKILWLTLYKVLKKENINHNEQETMTKFTGSADNNNN